jgi:lysophospholipase L1-like esterase
MKTVLCFGDSLTWGSNADTGSRHALEDRWPEVLRRGLGAGVEVISNGLRGRTTAYDEHLADCDRNGARILPTVLYTHAPIDLVIIMLGSNDLKPHIAGTALAAMQGIRRCVEIVRINAMRDGSSEPPDVLIVAPPPLCETADPEYSAMFAGGIEQGKMLASFYADLADEQGCDFFDAGTVARTTPVDGVHLDAENTRAIGRALTPIAKLILGL